MCGIKLLRKVRNQTSLQLEITVNIFSDCFRSALVLEEITYLTFHQLNKCGSSSRRTLIEKINNLERNMQSNPDSFHKCTFHFEHKKYSQRSNWIQECNTKMDKNTEHDTLQKICTCKWGKTMITFHWIAKLVCLNSLFGLIVYACVN